MTDGPGGPGTTPASIEAVLAAQANAAMQAGADPQATTARLGQMVAHVRANPEFAQQASDALRRGADARAVTGRIWSTVQQAAQDKQARMTSTGDEAHGGVLPSALDAMTFGLSRKAIAAGQAVVSDGLTGHVGDAYRQNVHAQEAASAQYHEAHPYVDDAAQVAGGVAGVVATGGTGAAGDAAQVGRLARYGKAIGTGAQYGVANALGHSDALMDGRGWSGVASDAGKGFALGGAMGAASIPLSAVASKAISATPLPRLAQGLADRMGAGTLGDAMGTRGLARAEIARRAGMDAEAAGVTAPPSRALSPLNRNLPRDLGTPALGAGPNAAADMELPRVGARPVPAPAADILANRPAPIALDQAGPNVEGLAEGIANRKGPGRAIIQKTLTDRAAQMRPAITNALEAGTGVEADAGMHPLQAALDARSAEAKALFGAARAETAGQSVSSETFDKIVRTPAGQKALAVAQARQGNIFADVPSVPPGYSPEQWTAVKAEMTARGIHVPENVGSPTSPLPDPETLHFMKEHLATLAKLGTQDGDAGALSQSAKGALSVWGKVRDELPDVWKRADDAYAARSRVIDMMNKGRKIYATPTNPAGGSAGQAIAKSLDGLDAKLASAPPAEQQALQDGAAMAAHGKLASARTGMKSPGQVFNSSPQVARQTSYAFPTDEHASAFQDVVGAWDKAQAQAERLTGGSPTARRAGEVGERDIVPLARLTSGRMRGILRSVVSNLDREYQAGKNSAIDTEIARILTSADGTALVKAATAGNLRARTALTLRLAAAGSLGATAGARAPQK